MTVLTTIPNGASLLDTRETINAALADIASLKAALLPFNPASLFAAGEQGVWGDLSDPFAVFQDAAGTIASAVDAPIGRVNDKSGRGNHMTQPTAAARPMLRRDARGELYAEFDGIDDHLVLPTAAIVPTGSVFGLFGVRLSASGSFPYVLGNTGDAAFTMLYVASIRAPRSVAAYADGTNTLVDGAARAIGEAHTFGLIFDRAAPALRQRINGVEASVPGMNKNLGSPASYAIGNLPGNTSALFPGRMYDMLVLSRLPTDAEITAVEKRTGARMGLVL